jgi:arabinofuranosyltransferase
LKNGGEVYNSGLEEKSMKNEPATGRMQIESKQYQALPALALLIFIFVLIRTAWISDDAYITFRVVENFLHGYGPVYNLGERVQAYTHPLWFFIISGVYAVVNGLFGRFFLAARLPWTVIVVSIICSTGAVWLFAKRIARTWWAAVAGILLLTFSRAFTDYSTSGLEEALTYLILVWFLARYFQLDQTAQLFQPKMIGGLTFIASLGVLNRLDTVLLYAPLLAWLLWKARSWSAIGYTILGILPVILWEIFSIFYYGFPFPNTYYAKIHTGIAQGVLFWQGIVYFLSTFNFDPFTLLVIFFAFTLVITLHKWKFLPLLAGILLYLIYILRIGGDFMSGRFFAAPFLIAVIVIVRMDLKREILIGLTVALCGVGLAFGVNPLASDASYRAAQLPGSGVVDERGSYYADRGLLNYTLAKPFPDFPWNERGWQRYNDNFKVEVLDAIGMIGYQTGPYYHVVDKLALPDALLARLPIAGEKTWQIGHFRRKIPEGYLETLQSGQNQIADPNLAAYYDRLSVAIKGDVFAEGRLLEIWRLNTGYYDGWLKAYPN